MKSHLRRVAAAWLTALIPASACGPFFPDTVLDRPQSALESPPVSFGTGLYQIAGRIQPAATIRGDDSRLSQIPLESAELRAWWQSAELPPDEIDRRIARYESVRRLLLGNLHELSSRNFPDQQEDPPQLAEHPLDGSFPAEVATYVEGARLLAIGQREAARDQWRKILGMPATERKLRSTWAAWMLASSSIDSKEAIGWYGRVESEANGGAADVLHLANDAKGWRAHFTQDHLEAIHLYYEVFTAGKHQAWVDVRTRIIALLDAGNPETYAAAAADPLVRRLINLHLHAAMDRDYQQSIPGDGAFAVALPAAWLAALEAHAPLPDDDSARIAWAFYSAGRYEDSRKWLAIADPARPLTLWLQAKFDLRDGKTDSASRHFDQALALRSKETDWAPNHLSGSPMRGDFKGIEGSNQARLMADSGVTALALRNYLPALENLRLGGFREDAAYLAENLISTDGLVKHVRKVAPRWSQPADPEKVIEPLTSLDRADVTFSTDSFTADDQLRYVLARRLARERRFAEAAEFMPPVLAPLLKHYAALDRAAVSGKHAAEVRAAILWRQARLHRRFGMELFSTDGAPDGGARSWSFEAIAFSDFRKRPKGWARENGWGEAIDARDAADFSNPTVTADELSRVSRFGIEDQPRYQYRYAAADIAWKAARNLPANHPRLAGIYNTAGQWLASRDPKAADRFYQALVRRCAATEEGKRAEAKRWFLTDMPAAVDLPALPSPFRHAP